MGVKDSDIPARSSGKTPEKVVTDSDTPSQLLGTQAGGDAVDTSETANG